MRLVSLYLLLLFFSVLSCSKEESFEVGAPARGSLQSSSTFECLPKIVAGSFIAGNALTDSNYIEVDIDVATTGSYSIKTETQNGYSFSGSGNLTKTGINRVRLAASGTPIAAGQDPFQLFFDSTSCLVPVTVLPAGSNSGPAVFTPQKGSGDSCIVATVAGNYVKGTALNGTSTVAIKVNVTNPGTYTVTTDTVNGFFFSGSNTLASIGEQTITLVASGTPETEGPTFFTVTAGGTTCTFLVTVSADATPPPVGTGDLFPLSTDSRWSYIFDVTAPEDTFEVRNIGTISFGGNTYQNFEFNSAGTPFDSFYYRKSGNDYLEYVDLNELIADLENEVKGDLLFLKDSPAAGTTWNSDFNIRINATDAVLRFAFTCTAANTTATVNGKAFGGVYKITMKLQTGVGGIFDDVGPQIETFYARGIGLIYERGNENAGDYQRLIKNWNVK